ncbi:MAG TPA: GNAT family N-acetyltransferase [Acidimicrobiales bacterium]|nr:GNAT family N-acetyltransferase [Acidimicrobiales bacterium]
MLAILLARMAVDVRHQGHGLGVRLLLIHANDEEARGFYGHYGFVGSPLDPLVMVILLADI